MTNNFLARAASGLVLAGVLGSVSTAALAANVTLTGWAFGSGGSVSATYGVGQSYGGAAGGFKGSLTGTPANAFDTNNFLTYCIELTEHFSFGTSAMGQYNVVAGSSYFANRHGNADKASQLGKLLTFVDANPSLVDSAAESTAMQLAVWNLVYDNDFSVTLAGSFNDASSYRTMANTLLAGAQGVSQSAFTVYALEKAGSQDFLLAARSPLPSTAVPEPASVGLVLSALAAGAWVRRRRSAAA